jgi:hypothetical protein
MDSIEKELGTEYSMFYNPALALTDILPGLSYTQAREQINASLKIHSKNFDQWHPGTRNTLARIMRANWIYQRLFQEPIKKPLLVRREDSKFRILCGDTRFMAVTADQSMQSIGVILTCPVLDNSYYKNWTQIMNNQDLVSVCGFDPQLTQIHVNKSNNIDYAIEWLEIGDNSTSHHLHDFDLRLNLMKKYLDQQAEDFEFSCDWITTPIHWIDNYS